MMCCGQRCVATVGLTAEGQAVHPVASVAYDTCKVVESTLRKALKYRLSVLTAHITPHPRCKI
jgi:hypothetical protein